MFHEVKHSFLKNKINVYTWPWDGIINLKFRDIFLLFFPFLEPCFSLLATSAFSPVSLFHYWQRLKMVEQTNVVPLVVNKYQKTNLTLKHGDMVWEVVFVYLDGGRLVLVWFLIKCLETSPSRLPPPPPPLLLHIRMFVLYYVELVIWYNILFLLPLCFPIIINWHLVLMTF